MYLARLDLDAVALAVHRDEYNVWKLFCHVDDYIAMLAWVDVELEAMLEEYHQRMEVVWGWIDG